jgi:hypothetical protein
VIKNFISTLSLIVTGLLTSVFRSSRIVAEFLRIPAKYYLPATAVVLLIVRFIILPDVDVFWR